MGLGIVFEGLGFQVLGSRRVLLPPASASLGLEGFKGMCSIGFRLGSLWLGWVYGLWVWGFYSAHSGKEFRGL